MDTDPRNQRLWTGTVVWLAVVGVGLMAFSWWGLRREALPHRVDVGQIGGEPALIEAPGAQPMGLASIAQEPLAPAHADPAPRTTPVKPRPAPGARVASAALEYQAPSEEAVLLPAMPVEDLSRIQLTARSVNLLLHYGIADTRARLKLCLDADGYPTKTEIVDSTGVAEVDAELLLKAQGWRYLPLEADGEPVASCTFVTVRHSVDKGS